MRASADDSPLWTPSAAQIEGAQLTAFGRAVGHGDSYEELWRWSVEEPAAFWGAIWDRYGVGEPQQDVLTWRSVADATWFPNARVNYARHLFAHAPAASEVAIHHASESRPSGEWTWSELERATAQLRAALAERGVGEGDRVAAYLPNIPETIAAFLACASLGAIWCSAAPEFGAQAVIDRFAQLGPTVLLAVDGYRYGGKTFDRTAEVDAIHEAVGGELLRFGYLDGTGWSAELAQDPPALTFADTAFDAPLWILFSSGTTGLPKPIVHGHGGILLEQLKHGHLHLDARPGDRVFWFTTTGWMMWNFLVGALHTGAAIVLYDGDPAGDVLWDLAERTQTTIFGTSAAFLTTAMRSGIHPTQGRDLAIRAVGSTGSPLPPEAFGWVVDEFGPGTWLFSTSGGTDVCTAFVGGVPTLPVYAGELQAPALGAKVESWSPEGEPLVGEVGELVITLPLPSMPLFFWGDDDGARLTDSYFATYPGIWRHGDWIELTDRGSAIIWGRSDATINRGGVRMGTSEIYRAVLAVPEIQDALVVDVPLDPVASTMWLFVVTAAGDVGEVDDDLRQRLARQIREQCSPRHVPNRVTAVPEIPRTLSGKVVEVPVKRILMGADPEAVLSRDSLSNPASLDPFVALAVATAPQ